MFRVSKMEYKNGHKIKENVKYCKQKRQQYMTLFILNFIS